MAHFAQIDENNIVTQILVTDNNDPNGDEGFQFITDRFGGVWIKTSYNTVRNEHKLGGTPLRGNFACIGMTYDSEKDLFLYPKPYPSWVLNESKADWEAPIEDTRDPLKPYEWNEDLLEWIEISE